MTKITMGLFPNTAKTEVLGALPGIVALGKDLGIRFLLPRELAQQYSCEAYESGDGESLSGISIAASLGGDGTFLRMTRELAFVDVPVIGVNFGKLGFLTEVESSQIDDALRKIAAGSYEVEKHSLLEARVYRGGELWQTAQALNDFVLSRGHSSRLTHLSVRIGGKASANYPSDGLIVATPTGSTAYNLSAGGPIVYPGLEATILTPICAHALHTRPIVIPMTEEVEIRSLTPEENVLLSADGEMLGELGPDDKVLISKSRFYVDFVKLNLLSYYETWQEKLMRKNN